MLSLFHFFVLLFSLPFFVPSFSTLCSHFNAFYNKILTIPFFPLFQSKLMFKTKGRLFADKINKNERKNKAEIIQLIEVLLSVYKNKKLVFVRY